MIKQPETTPLGVIDVLSGGFALIVRRPWILLLPIALDLFLWFGPAISAEPVLRPLFATMSLPEGLSPEAAQGWNEFKTALVDGSGKFNVLSALTMFALGLPSLVGVIAPTSEGLPVRAPWITLNDGVFLTMLTLALALVGMLLASFFLEAVARGIRSESKGSLVARSFKAWLNLLALLALGIIALTLLMIPIMLVAVLLSALSQVLGGFVVLLGMTMILWAALYLAFALPAIFVSGLNVRQAILNSITVFRVTPRAALTLLFLMYLIQMGFAIVWDSLLVNVWGLAFDILANAFLGSGLIAALMLFYNDRATWIVQWQAHAQKASKS